MSNINAALPIASERALGFKEALINVTCASSGFCTVRLRRADANGRDDPYPVRTLASRAAPSGPLHNTHIAYADRSLVISP